jgi:hypothetical protein
LMLSVTSRALKSASFTFSMSGFSATGAAGSCHLYQRVCGHEILRPGFFIHAFEYFRGIQFGDNATGFANQQGRRLSFMGMGTGDKSIAAFNLVHETVGEQKIQSAVNCDGGWARPLLCHAFDNVIGTNSSMASRHAGKNVAALARQLAAAPLTGPFSPRDQVGGAVGVVVVGVEECHIVII